MQATATAAEQSTSSCQQPARIQALCHDDARRHRRLREKGQQRCCSYQRRCPSRVSRWLANANHRRMVSSFAHLPDKANGRIREASPSHIALILATLLAHQAIPPLVNLAGSNKRRRVFSSSPLSSSATSSTGRCSAYARLAIFAAFS